MKLRFTAKLALAFCLTLLVPFNSLSAQQESSQASANNSDAQQAVIDSVKTYVEAYNRRDAAALSQHWSETGTWVDDDGSAVQGRENIRKAFAAIFSEMKADPSLTVNVRKVSLVTDDVALEEGSSGVAGGAQADYTAIHKLENGQWNLYRVKEHAAPQQAPHNHHLQELDWMIGDWVDQSGGATVESSCRWSKNGNFITKNFRVTIAGLDTLEGTQVIGYDASTNTIRSWMFDSDGGHSAGMWTKNGNVWEAQSSQVLADGRVASSTNIFTPRNEGRFDWKSTKRTLDGVSL
ncbi:MAG: SgcJ/EcaC family oxidoreductase, partial [Pirellulaceae bacterium]|nr:SgcJ/EcaC family oxidoreductase [Pirellulaceae bacterium]